MKWKRQADGSWGFERTQKQSVKTKDENPVVKVEKAEKPVEKAEKKEKE
jgi:hypothetical protein